MVSLEYMAGFFDGEGCICVSHHRYKNGQIYCNGIVSVTQGILRASVLEDFAARFGGRIYNCTNNTYKFWKISRVAEIEEFCKVMKDLLVQKKVQAVLMLEFLRCRGERRRRFELSLKISEHNSLGKRKVMRKEDL